MPTRSNREPHRMTGPITPRLSGLSRRNFFSTVVDGVYGAALAHLLGTDLFSANRLLGASLEETEGHDLKSKPSHFEPKAKAVIQLFMNGGPSQVDLFDPKP